MGHFTRTARAIESLGRASIDRISWSRSRKIRAKKVLSSIVVITTRATAAPSPWITCCNRSCVSGRSKTWLRSAMLIELASAGPIQIGR